MALINSLRTALTKRAQYNITLRELRALPTELAIEDLGLYPGDAAKIARASVYGA